MAESQGKSMSVSSFKALLTRIGGIALSYAVSVFIARLYGASGVGIFAISQMVLMIGGSVSKVGLDIFFLKLVSSENIENQKESLKSDYINSVKLIFFIGLGVSLFIWFLIPFLAQDIFKIPSSEKAMRIAVLGIVPFGLYKLNQEAVRGLGKSTSYVALDRIWPFLTMLLLLFVFSEYFRGVSAVAWYFNFGLMVSLFIGFYQWNKAMGLRRTKSLLRYKLKSLFQSSFPMMITGMMFLIMGWTDKFMLATYLTESQVGQYEVALKLANLGTLALFAVNAVVTPQFAKAFKEGALQKLQNLARDSANLIVILVLPLVSVLLLGADFFIGMFGEGFSEVKPILYILIVGQLVNSFSGSVLNILQMTGNQLTAQYIMIVAALVNVVLNLLLVPSFGMVGAAYATAIGVVFWNLVSVYAVYKKVGVLAIMSPLQMGKSIQNILRRR